MSWPASSLTLALDGSTPGPSVAVIRGDDVVVEHAAEPEPRRGRRLMEMVGAAMGEAGASPGDLGGVVVGVGPGGFTGLRIALATAAGVAQGQGLPLIGASSLEALALGIARSAPEATLLAPATDARRRQVFGAVYRPVPGGLEIVDPPGAYSPEDFAARVAAHGQAGEVAGAGTGYAAYDDELAGIAGVAGSAHPAAPDLVRRVRDGAGRPASPDYLRLPDAERDRRRREGEE